MRRVELLLAVFVTLGCQGYDEPLVPELEVPFCEIANTRTGSLGFVGEDGVFTGFDGPQATCPVINSWRAISAPTSVQVYGLQPRGVQGVITWTLEGDPVGEEEFTADLLCPDGDDDATPIALPISIGEQYGPPEYYAGEGRPGTISVKVTVAGQDPRTCDPTDANSVRCVSMTEDVVFTLSQ